MSQTDSNSAPVQRRSYDPAQGPIADFFRANAGFEYNPANDAMSEWRRLRVFKFRGRMPGIRKLRNQLGIAVIQAFNNRFGTDAHSLDAWQELCRCIDIPVPGTLSECKKAVDKVFINLWDLAELRDGHSITKFKTERMLSTYTLEEDKIFPRSAVKETLLAALLRNIYNPRYSKKDGKTRKERTE